MGSHRRERSLNDLKLTHCGVGTTKSQPYGLVAKAWLLEYALRRETRSASESIPSNCGNLCRCQIVPYHTLVGLESAG